LKNRVGKNAKSSRERKKLNDCDEQERRTTGKSSCGGLAATMAKKVQKKEASGRKIIKKTREKEDVHRGNYRKHVKRNFVRTITRTVHPKQHQGRGKKE